jgi:hypothetical protein
VGVFFSVFFLFLSFIFFEKNMKKLNEDSAVRVSNLFNFTENKEDILDVTAPRAEAS